MKKIILVAGARPNFMKVAPIMRSLDASGLFNRVLVHTGQHYDDKMSGAFFNSLGIPEPDYNLEVGSASHACQTAEIMRRFEKVCLDEKPDMVLVVGDVNSTIAAGLVAKKLGHTLIHVEAGLRSGDREMPEEINRLATDAISDIFFATERQAEQNLLNEGHSADSIHFVGHVMIDNLFYQLESMSEETLNKQVVDLKQRLSEQYLCLTLHRPSNVDSREVLSTLLQGIHELAKQTPVIFPCHPRTREMIRQFGLEQYLVSEPEQAELITSGIIVIEPLVYNDFLFLWKDSLAVITDSGGLQEETTAMGIPCLTLRENTERPITIDYGTNLLIGSDMEYLQQEVDKIRQHNGKSGQIPELWDGRAADRIVEILSR